MTLNTRKQRLIELIASLDNELLINKLEMLLDNLNPPDGILLQLSKPTKTKLDIETLMEEQNYRHPTKELLNNIIAEANIEESIEDLLEMI